MYDAYWRAERWRGQPVVLGAKHERVTPERKSEGWEVCEYCLLTAATPATPSNCRQLGAFFKTDADLKDAAEQLPPGLYRAHLVFRFYENANPFPVISHVSGTFVDVRVEGDAAAPAFVRFRVSLVGIDEDEWSWSLEGYNGETWELLGDGCEYSRSEALALLSALRKTYGSNDQNTALSPI